MTPAADSGTGIKTLMNDASAPIGEMLRSRPPVVSDEEAVGVACAMFGVGAHARRLTAERDLNFHLVASDGREFLLKITNPAEPRGVTDLQTQALLHIEREDPSLPVPRVQKTLDGAPQAIWRAAGGEESVVRLLSFLHGEQLYRLQRSSAQRRNIGKCLAALDEVLGSFEHPAAEHDLLWDIKHASRLRALLPATAETEVRELAERFLDIFDAEVLPVLPSLAWQVIHNDFNLHNILADPTDHDRISGVLDFGDMVRTPRIVDVAVAAAYHICHEGHPLGGVAELIGAYHSSLPLTPAELDVLYELIAIRMVTTIVITNWRAARYPENSGYILRNNPPARAGLLRIAGLSRAQSRAYLIQACGLE